MGERVLNQLEAGNPRLR